MQKFLVGMKMMLQKIEVGLMKIMLSWNISCIWWPSYTKDFARTSACAKTSLRPNVLLRSYYTTGQRLKVL